MTQIVRVEAFAVAIDHHYKVAGVDHRPGALPGTPYYLEPAWSQVYSTQAMTCIVRVTANDGGQGWGECQAPIAPEVTLAVIQELLGPALLGRDPRDVEAERDRLVGLMAVRGHHAGFFADAVAGIDLALWDLAARSTGQPLAALVGGDANRTVPLYVSGLRQPTLAEQVDRARNLISDGYQGVKVFLWGTPESMAEQVRVLRTVLGPEVRIMVDLLWGQALENAQRFALLVEDLNVEFLEAPLPVAALEDHGMLARSTRIPLAAGEHVHTVAEARALLSQGIQVLQPDVARTGITEGLRIAAVACSHGAEVTWHVGTCSPVAMTASWAMATAVPTQRLQEHQVDLLPAMNALVSAPLKVVDGAGTISPRPGTGLHVDECAVRAASTRVCDVRA
jgi:L-alanine-DL-glutamate epimerase-like enolase superfamily enzyme